jgi:arylsulfatase A-like enzyme
VRKSILSARWPWITAAVLVVVAYLSTFVEIRIGGLDSRPKGSADDIAKLALRDDLNVLFVLIDTLRADRLGSYGYERDTSPILDHLASRGVRFARHLAQSSWTKSSMASLWTGLYPARSGVTRYEHVIAPEATMPAEIFREAGFHTAGIFRNGWVEGYFGFDQGFDSYDRPVPMAPPATVRRENPTIKGVGTDADAVLAAIEFLRIRGGQRWLLYLHLMDVHEYLYDEDSALFGTSYSDVYDNSIRRENQVLGELLAHLAREGHLERTLVAIASDHGEAFGERGFEGHARRVYRETTEVPFILSLPFHLEPGVVVRSRTRNVDIWPTLLDLLGLPAMEGVDGRSLVPEILAAARGETPAPDAEDAVAHLDQTWGRRVREPAPTVAVAEQGFRYVFSRDVRGRTREELFDADSDGRELENVIAERSDVAARLRARAETYLEGEPPWGGETPTLELDEIQLNQLRALGYAVP